MKNRYTAILEKESNMYVAICPELDVASQGATVEKATCNIKEAVELFLECADKKEIQQRERSELYKIYPQVIENETLISSPDFIGRSNPLYPKVSLRVPILWSEAIPNLMKVVLIFIFTAQFGFAQTIDFTNISPAEEKELYELYINNHLSPEKLTKEKKQAWDAKIEKEITQQKLKDDEQKQQPETKLLSEDNKSINQNENKSSYEKEINYLQEGKMLSKEESIEIEKKEQEIYQKKLSELKEIPKN